MAEPTFSRCPTAFVRPRAGGVSERFTADSKRPTDKLLDSLKLARRRCRENLQTLSWHASAVFQRININSFSVLARLMHGIQCFDFVYERGRFNATKDASRNCGRRRRRPGGTNH